MAVFTRLVRFVVMSALAFMGGVEVGEGIRAMDSDIALVGLIAIGVAFAVSRAASTDSERRGE